MKVKYKKILFFFFIVFFIFVSISKVIAVGTGCSKMAGEVCLDNPLGETSPQTLIGTVINAVLGLVGSLALAMFIYGGLVWMTAAGNQERVTKGRNILIWATIGLIVIFSAYAMVRFVFTGIGVG